MDFSTELQLFRERTDDPGYEALILLGTQQAITAALLIGALPVQRVAFLLTEETREMPADVAKLLDCSADDWLCPDGNHNTTLAVYQGLRTLLDEWGDLDRSKIAVDLTGGMKPMSLGLEKAAHVLGLQTIYVQSEYEKKHDGRSGPKQGSQQLVVPPDPYVVFGDLEAAEATRLFNAHDYNAAQRIFSELARRVPVPDSERYKAIAQLAAAYAAWDLFDLRAADDLLNTLQSSGVLDPISSDRIQDHIAMLTPVVALIGMPRPRRNDGAAISRFVARQIERLRNVKTGGGLLAMFYANALRRANQQRFDSAALMLYRCLELMSQQRLATHGVMTEYPRDGLRSLGQRIPQITEDYGATHQRVLQRPNNYGVPKKITLIAGYVLLATIDDPFAKRCKIKLIEDRAEARNQSILAHGFEYVDPEDYREFKEIVDETINHWSAAAGVVWPEILQHTSFLQPDEVLGGGRL